MKIHFKELAVGAAVASLLVSPWSTLFAPQPYKDVEIVSVMEVADYVIVKANFYKNENADNNDHDEDYDRAVGKQTLRIKIFTNGNPYDQFEIRTRHVCEDGKVIDGVFATIDSKLRKIKGSVHDA